MLLEPIKVLAALQHDDHRGQAAGHHTGLCTPTTTGSAAATASSISLRTFYQRWLAISAFAVVPGDLVLKPVPGRVLRGQKRYGLDRPRRSLPVLAARHPSSLRSAPDSLDLRYDKVVEFHLHRLIFSFRLLRHPEADGAGL